MKKEDRVRDSYIVSHVCLDSSVVSVVTWDEGLTVLLKKLIGKAGKLCLRLQLSAKEEKKKELKSFYFN